MTRSDIPTRHILVRAETSFDGDPCDFAIVDMSGEIVKMLKRYVAATNSIDLAGFREYDTSTFYCSLCMFFRTGRSCSKDTLNQLLGGNSWSFVELTEEEKNDFEIPESEIGEEKIEVRRSGAFIFTALGEDTDTHFRTHSIYLQGIETFFE